MEQLFTHVQHGFDIISIYIQLHYTISFNIRQISRDSMQYLYSERRKKNERFRVSIRFGLPPYMVNFDYLFLKK